MLNVDNYISISKPKILDKQLLQYELSISKNLKKYFQNSLFFVKYDVDIKNVEPSILQIPVISSISPVVWAAGGNIYVKDVDEIFLKSIIKIKKTFKTYYGDLAVVYIIADICRPDLLVEIEGKVILE